MPKQVRVDIDVDALPLGPVFDPGLNGARTDATTAVTDEQRLLIGAGHILARDRPLSQCFQRLPAHRNDAVLVAFARDPHRCVVHIDITEVQVGQLGQAQARRIEELQYGPVTVDDWAIAGNLQQTSHTVGIEVIGQAFAAFWRGHRCDGVLADFLLADQVAKKRARGGQAALDALPAETLAKTGCGVRPNMLAVEVSPLGNT